MLPSSNERQLIRNSWIVVATCSACSLTDLDGLTSGEANDAGALMASVPAPVQPSPVAVPSNDDVEPVPAAPEPVSGSGGSNASPTDASTEPMGQSVDAGPIASNEPVPFAIEAGVEPEPSPEPPEPEPEVFLDAAPGFPRLDSGTASDAGQARPPEGDESWLYWLAHGSDTVGRARLDGSGPEQLFQRPGALSYFRSIAIDPVGNGIFFTDDERGEVLRAELDGDNARVLLSGIDDPVGIDVDLVNQKLYIVDQGDEPRVYRTNLDGSDVEIVIESGLLHPYGIALDIAGDRLYVIDNDADDVFAARLDGSQFTPLGIPDMVAPIEVTLDVTAGTLYWCDIGPPAVIRAARIDGSEVRDVLTPGTFSNLEIPLGITFDAVSQRLYFVEGGALAALVSMNADGSDVQVLVDGLDDPVGIEVSRE